MNRFHGLMAGIAATALLASCATGMAVPGFGDGSGCRTIYVYRSTGGIQPISNCGAGALPRDTLSKTLMAKSATPQSPASAQLEGQSGNVLQDADAAAQVTPVSKAALSTAPYDVPPAGYPGANEMLEAADMSAFMARVRTDYSKKQNAGAWGYVVVDAIAADDPALAQSAIDAMAERPPPEWLSANHLRPWVYAANSRSADAQAEMAKLRRLLPAATLLGHRALLAEGVGDTAGALTIYESAPQKLDPPKPNEVSNPDYLPRAMAFNSQRLLMLRQAELLRGLNRDPEAVEVLTRLLAAQPDDGYVRNRLEKAKSGEDRQKPRTLKRAMAVALSDEADLVEERQNIMGLMVGRGGKIPFNHLISSFRQGALLLDPDNGDIRLAEVGALYSGGKFEPALRMAQIGNPPKAQAAALWSTAGLAALELGSPDTLVAMTDRALAIDNSAEAKIQAAGALTTGGKADRAIQSDRPGAKAGPDAGPAGVRPDLQGPGASAGRQCARRGRLGARRTQAARRRQHQAVPRLDAGGIDGEA